MAVVHCCSHGMAKVRGRNQLAGGVIAGRCKDKLRLTVVASQIVFLYTALPDRTSTTTDESVRRINKAVRAIVTIDDNHIGNEEEVTTAVYRWTSTHGPPTQNSPDAKEVSRTCAERHAEDSTHRTIVARLLLRRRRWEPRPLPDRPSAKGGPWPRFTQTKYQHDGWSHLPHGGHNRAPHKKDMPIANGFHKDADIAVDTKQACLQGNR